MSDGTADTLQSFNHVFNTFGNQTIKLKVISGICIDSVIQTLFISRKPKADFTPMNTAGCPPLSISFINKTDTATSYKWYFGDGIISGSKDTIHTYVNKSNHDTVLNVTLIASTGTGCADTAISNVTIYQAPVTSFTSDLNSKPNCGPDTVHFVSTSQPSSGILFNWDFGDGTSSTVDSVVKIFQNNNIYPLYFTIKLITSTLLHQCRDTSAEQVVTIYPKPQTSFLIDTIQLCPPAKFNFWAPPEKQATYTWDFGSGNRINVSTTKYQKTLDNSGTGDTSYYVKLISVSQFGCSDSTTVTITIPGKAKSLFSASPVSQKYPNTTISISNKAVNNPGDLYSWTFGDNIGTSNLISPTDYTYNKWGKYTISQNVKNSEGCADSSFQTIVIIAPTPVLKISVDSSSGCPPLTVNFKDISLYNDTTFDTWDFGDGVKAAGVSVQHTFYQSGDIRVRFSTKDFNGNSYFIDTVLTVYNLPSASFYAVPLNPEIPDDSVFCIPLYPDTVEGGEQYNWNFGDSTTSNNQRPAHIYQYGGKYYITLTVVSINDCKNSYTLNTPVEPVIGGKISYPNAFMPNMSGPIGGNSSENDVSNKIFSPVTAGVTEYHLEIYNSWGQLLFSSNDKTIGWDGYYKGSLCKQDVYVWKVTGVYSSGKSFAKTGNVTLFHSKK